MIEPSIEKLEKLGKWNTIMEAYFEESIEASNTDDIAGVYDKELDDKKISNCEKEELLETGIEKAIC